MTDQPTPHVFEAAYYARLAEIERRHWWAIGMRGVATQMVDRLAGGVRHWRVLDAGCGTGFTLEWVRRYTDVEPVGLDRAPEALGYCRAGGHRRLVLGTATSLPFSTGFDLVLSGDVIQHLPRPGGDLEALGEIARVLRPGGWLVLRTNSRCGYGPTTALDYHRYTVGEVRALAEQAGLEVRQVTYANMIPGALATARRVLAGRRTGKGDPGLSLTSRPPDTNLVTRLLFSTLRFEARWIGRWGRTLPFGHAIFLLARRPDATMASR
jgi:SAM-dependent methyltransferase